MNKRKIFKPNVFLLNKNCFLYFFLSGFFYIFFLCLNVFPLIHATEDLKPSTPEDLIIEENENQGIKDSNENYDYDNKKEDETKARQKKKVYWMFVSSEDYLNPENDFKDPRLSFEVKPEKVSHIKVDENLKNLPRHIDVERLNTFFKENDYVDGELIEALHLGVSRSIQKQLLFQKFKDFFNDRFVKNKILFLSGICEENGVFNYIKDNLKDKEKITYDEIYEIWNSRRRSDVQTELMLIVDCKGSGYWTRRCNERLDYKDFFVQASSTDNEDSHDIKDFGSLFINNFIHAQKTLNRTMIDTLITPYDEFKYQVLENPIISNSYLEKKEEEEMAEKLKLQGSIDLAILPDSRLIHLYQQTPSSCGMFFKAYEIFGLNSMFNSWDEIVKVDGYYREKNFTEIKAIYKGEFKDGKPHGKGAIYYMSIEEKYIGDFVFSEKQGKGMYFYNDTNIFEGVFRKDKKIRGVLHGYNGDWYKGDFKNENMGGNGIFFNREKGYTYEGEFKNGVQDGNGTTAYPSGVKYVGFHKNNDLNGVASLYYNSSLISVANYKDGHRNGNGWFLLREGHNYTGNFIQGVAQGKGKMIFKTNDTFEGDFIDGKPHGYGVYRYINGNVYEGPVVNGRRHGKGVMEIKNGDKYEGQFTEDSITGNGVLYYEKGIYKGDFLNGKFHGKGVIHLKSGGRFEGDFREGRIYRNDDDL